MNIVIVGDGKVGSALTEHLSKEGHNVVIIDKDPKVVEEKVNTYDVMGVCGNGASYNVQKEAGVDKARLLIVATSSDELNILCCLVAKKIGAHHTVARVRNPEYAHQLHFFKEELGLSLIVNPEYAAANEIARVLRYPTAINMESFAGGRVDLAEIKITDGNPLGGMCVRDISNRFKAHVLICAVQRGDDVFIPNGDFRLQIGDRVHITSDRNEMVAFMKELRIYKHRTKNVLVSGGGFKVERLMVLCKAVFCEIRKALNGKEVVTVKADGKTVDRKEVYNVLAYLGAYVVVVFIGVFLVCLDNVDMPEAISAVLTCFNNVGPAFGRLSPTGNFSVLSGFSKLVLSFLMLAGRLEIYPMLIVFYYKAWKRRN